MTTPRIYVACLAAYNAGRLHGVWIDADQSPEDIYSEVSDMLAVSPEPGAEEWAIHDYEGFGDLRLSEWESFERVSAIAAGIAKHGLAFAAWLSYDDSREPADLEAFDDAYRGEWESLRAYAEDWADSTGLYAEAERAGSPYVTVDIDALERDLDIEMCSLSRRTMAVAGVPALELRCQSILVRNDKVEPLVGVTLLGSGRRQLRLA